MRRGRAETQRSPTPTSSLVDQGLIWVGVVGLFGALFGQLFWESLVLAFRDTAHYYYPLLQYVRNQWLEGEIPLWNPYDNLGAPLAADPTSLAFYPGILLLFVGQSFGQALNLFIVAHFTLAFYGSWKLARRWGAPPAGAALAGISYVFGGIVLFQYSNLVYLVGASWLPLAIVTFDQAVRSPRPAHSVLAGLTLGCVILGGDLQTAYHIVLLWLSYILLLRVGNERSLGEISAGTVSAGYAPVATVSAGHAPIPVPTADPNSQGPFEPKGPAPKKPPPRPWWVWFGAVAIAAGLSTLVWLPAAEFAFLSDRQITAEPRSLYEWVYQAVAGGSESSSAQRLPSFRSLLGRTQPGTHHEAVFDFSLAPTRWGEFLWPNFAGKTFPLNHRWLSALGGEDRIWTPSLYMGLIPFLLALLAFRLKAGIHPAACWLSWMVIFSLLASLGYFGLGYLVEWYFRLTGQNLEEPLPVGPAFGGLYWLLTVLLPGYVAFRYPSKWLVITALGISQLAALGLAEAFRPGRRAFAALCFVITLLNAGLLGVAFIFRGELEDRLMQAPPDPAFGPIVPGGCTSDLIWSFTQAVGVGLTTAVLVLLFTKRSPSLLVVLTCLDLAIANRWMLVAVDERELNSPPVIAHTLLAEVGLQRESQENLLGNTPLLRIYREAMEVAPSWRQFSSDRRLTEIVAWHRDSLFSKFHLLVPVGSLSPGVCYRPADWQFALWVCQKPPTRTPSPSKQQHPPVLPRGDQPANSPSHELAFPNSAYVPPCASAALLQHHTMAVGMTPVIGEQALVVPTGMVLWRRLEPVPFVWLTHEVEVLPELRSRDPRIVWQRTAEVLFPNGSLRDFQRHSVLEMPAEAFSLVAAVAKIRSGSAAPLWGQSTRDGSKELPDFTPKAGKLPAHAISLSHQATADPGEGGNTSAPPAASPDEEHPGLLSELSSNGWCRLLAYRPTRIQVQVYAPAGGVVVIAQQYYPGWRAWVDSVEGSLPSRLPCSIWRANRVMQGIVVPPGNWLLTITYRPLSFRIGAVLSFFSLLAVTAWLALFSATRTQSAFPHFPESVGSPPPGLLPPDPLGMLIPAEPTPPEVDQQALSPPHQLGDQQS